MNHAKRKQPTTLVTQARLLNETLSEDILPLVER
jgi:hypothetical protein|tara:strand:- start:520 stop:621 length:102 start_codon:yes stop_codon:yes gene_type:complete